MLSTSDTAKKMREVERDRERGRAEGGWEGDTGRWGEVERRGREAGRDQQKDMRRGGKMPKEKNVTIRDQRRHRNSEWGAQKHRGKHRHRETDTETERWREKQRETDLLWRFWGPGGLPSLWPASSAPGGPYSPFFLTAVQALLWLLEAPSWCSQASLQKPAGSQRLHRPWCGEDPWNPGPQCAPLLPPCSSQTSSAPACSAWIQWDSREAMMTQR